MYGLKQICAGEAAEEVVVPSTTAVSVWSLHADIPPLLLSGGHPRHTTVPENTITAAFPNVRVRKHCGPADSGQARCAS